MKLIHFINNKASWKLVLILFLTSAILGTCIITMFFGLIELNSEATMDSLTFYSAKIFYKNLDIQGESGRRNYLLLHILDYLFITQFYFLFANLLALLARKISQSGKLNALCLLPFLAAIMDLLENISVDISILIYPDKFAIFGNLSGFFTLIKMCSIYAIFIILIVFLIIMLIKRIKTGNDKCSQS